MVKPNKIFFFLMVFGCFAVPSGKVGAWGYSPNNRWALVAVVPGVGLRYGITTQYGVEGRVLLGDGFAVSLRGDSKWDRFGWKVKPLAGLELSVLSEVGKDNRTGAALGAFVGGEVPISGGLTMQMDFGPAAVWLERTESKKDEWAYANVVNFSMKYYFGRNIR